MLTINLVIRMRPNRRHRVNSTPEKNYTPDNLRYDLIGLQHCRHRAPVDNVSLTSGML